LGQKKRKKKKGQDFQWPQSPRFISGDAPRRKRKKDRKSSDFLFFYLMQTNSPKCRGGSRTKRARFRGIKRFRSKGRAINTHCKPADRGFIWDFGQYSSRKKIKGATVIRFGRKPISAFQQNEALRPEQGILPGQIEKNRRQNGMGPTGGN